VVNVTLQTPVVTPSLRVQLMPAGALVIVPPPREPAVGAMTSVAGIAAAAKPAPTVVVLPGATVALHIMPEHAPVNPANAALPVLTASSETDMPPAKTAEQSPVATPAAILQLIPSGMLVTVPAPVPNPATTSVPGDCGMRNVASTVRWPFTVTTQGLPTQFALQAWKIVPATGSCASVTSVPTGKLLLHDPAPGAVPFSRQSIPAGVLTIRPPPTEPAFATTERKFGTNVAVTVRGASIVV